MHKGSGYRSFERVDLLVPVDWPHTWPRQFVYANDIASISLDPFDERYDTVSDNAYLSDDERFITWLWTIPLSTGATLYIELDCLIPDGDGAADFYWSLVNSVTGAYIVEYYHWPGAGLGFSPRRISFVMDELHPPFYRDYSTPDPFDIPGSWLAPIVNSKQYH